VSEQAYSGELTESMKAALVWAMQHNGYVFSTGIIRFPTTTCRALARRGLTTQLAMRDGWELTALGRATAKARGEG
jgi:hypothetical protein